MRRIQNGWSTCVSNRLRAVKTAAYSVNRVLLLLFGAAILLPSKSITAQLYDAPQTIATLASLFPTSVDLTDVDLDGDLDLLGIGFNSLVWYANDGTGNFGPEQIIDASFRPAYHLLADLNHDGITDLALSDQQNDAIKVLFGSIGAFSAPVTIATVANPNRLDAADLDMDGQIDLVYSAEWEVGWMSGDGLGGFGSPQTIATNATSPDYADVVAADLDNDGDPDLAYTWYGEDAVVWQENLGVASFGAQQFMAQTINRVDQIHALDLDLDGDLELVGSSNFNTGTVAYFDNLGGAGFSNRINIVLNADGPEGVCFGDITGNGYPDLVLATFANEELLYVPNQFGSFANPESILATTTTQFVGAALGDLDGDALLDVATGSRAVPPVTDKFQWFRNLRSSCDARSAPDGLSHLAMASVVQLNWNAIDQSVGCQLSATRTSPPGPSVNRAFLGSELDGATVPIGLLGPGNSWEWQVRCACNTNPLIPTQFSNPDLFTVPLLHGSEYQNEIPVLFPNPASDRIRLEGEGEFRVLNALGQTVWADRVQGHQWLSVQDWPVGCYFLSFGDALRQFQVTH